MSITPSGHSKEIRVAAFLSIDTEHGRSILRGIARYFRHRSEVTVLKFGQTGNYDLNQLRRLRVDGVIAKVGSRRDEEVLIQLGVPVMNISGQMERGTLPKVDSDDSRVGELAFQHLYSRGHRRFAYCGNPKHHASALRMESFCRAARKTEGCSVVSVYSLPLGDQDAPYAERVRENLSDWVCSLPKPVGIFTFTDRVAVEVEEVCARAEIQVPAEVALLGVGNDLTRIEFSHVELSSVQLNSERIGLLAAESLDQMLSSQSKPMERILVPPQKIVIRRSTDRYAVSDVEVSESLDYIRQHIGNIIYVSEIARTVGVSRRSLELRFRSALGESIYEAVQRLKMDHAIDLLADLNMPVGEVAFATGFSDQKAFSRVFRKRMKETPSQFRERLIMREV